MIPRQSSSNLPEAGELDDKGGEPPSAHQRLQPVIGIDDGSGQQLSQGTGKRLREILEEKRKRAGRYSSEDVHRALFEEPPEPRTLEELKEGVRQCMKDRHVRP